ncbi:MAG: hypothetical protein MUF08_00540 [Burkholderiaceae bacterium]|jgi:phosphoglycerate-specific signal transduction histidine kinase|nr:hypothetical protein [Burkholderiaceae bacterium]
MSIYEILITCVAAINLVLTLHNMRANGEKANSARLHEIEVSLRAKIQEHEGQLNRLLGQTEQAITHDHLDQVYADLRSIAQQVHQLVGQQQQMNDNLRLLLARLVRE